MVTRLSSSSIPTVVATSPQWHSSSSCLHLDRSRSINIIHGRECCAGSLQQLQQPPGVFFFVFIESCCSIWLQTDSSLATMSSQQIGQRRRRIRERLARSPPPTTSQVRLDSASLSPRQIAQLGVGAGSAGSANKIVPLPAWMKLPKVFQSLLLPHHHLLLTWLGSHRFRSVTSFQSSACFQQFGVAIFSHVFFMHIWSIVS